ncbi:protein of unknown function [Burkholderia multivorans]
MFFIRLKFSPVNRISAVSGLFPRFVEFFAYKACECLQNFVGGEINFDAILEVQPVNYAPRGLGLPRSGDPSPQEGMRAAIRADPGLCADRAF